ncbi:thrombospondin type 3 repeat-containing protein [Sorangium sp. So ce185]|uniref:thrombospondin type 3 repeat-containing protein n=1 Tax=Sorangium sp. So ce185 TaxID=3133287 RepID=UPI003F5FE7DD
MRLEHEGWSFSLATARYGCAGALRPVGSVEPTGEKNRVEYRRDGATGVGLVEWYVNGPLGLEQGFTLPAAPDCGNGARPEEVVIELSVAGAVPAQSVDGGGEVTLREPGGTRVARYGELYVHDDVEQQLPARLEVRDGSVAIRVDVRRAAYPVLVDPFVWVLSKVSANDGMPYDYFGSSVALSGDTAVVGAPYDDGHGSVYIFARIGDAWFQQIKLSPHDASGDDRFGVSVAISGDTVLIGAERNDSRGSETGAAYVFVRSGAAWSLQAKLHPAGVVHDAAFGHSVAISGDLALVGSPNHSLVHVFARDGGVWSEQDVISDIDGFSSFGQSVSLSGDTALIGAPNGHVVGGPTAGVAHVFVGTRTRWTRQAELRPGDLGSRASFGESVAIAGQTALVGAPHAAGPDSGAAYIFVRSGATWLQQHRVVENRGDFGISVALEGDAAVIGPSWDSDAGMSAARVFVRSGVTWSLEASLTSTDGVADDYFGTAVALSGDTALVGAYREDDSGTDSGMVYSFRLQLPVGSACTTALECGSGYCVDGSCCNTTCAGLCEACSVAAGAVVDGTCGPVTGPVCDDGDACTQTDTCQAGLCIGSTPVDCAPPGACHEPGICEPATGECAYLPKPAGSPCGPATCSGALMELPDQCDGLGACTDGGSQNCGLFLCAEATCLTTCASNATCVPEAYCAAGTCSPKKPLGDPCAATNECLNAQCLGGVCSPDSDGDGVPNPTDNCPTVPNPTQADANDDGRGDACDCASPPRPDGAACDDGNLCTQGDTCQDGVCLSGTHVTCPDVAVCIAGRCDPRTGACVPAPKLEGTPCVDGGQRGVCLASGCSIELPPGSGSGGDDGSSSAGAAGSGGSGGADDGSTSVSSNGSGGAGGSGPDAGGAPGMIPAPDGHARLHGNGCATGDAPSGGSGELSVLVGLLLAARRRVGETRSRMPRC